jgi:glycosyltransferase involved in cell wall biosynthesis
VLLRHYPQLEIDVFFYQDLGGVALFNQYIRARNLGERFQIRQTFDPGRYDAIFPVDTPRIIEDCPPIEDRVYMECHTHYSENRTYLREWESRLKVLIVPSPEFRSVIEAERPGLRGKIKVVRNFVPPVPELDRELSLPDWKPPLFLYFGRIDELKNFAEFVEGLSHARHHLGTKPLGIASGQLLQGYPLKEVIDKNQMSGSVLLLPPVPFAKSHVLMQLLRQKKGVFVSPSKGESFGLSAAEAMASGLPVILSDIPPHRSLVAGQRKFLYPLGDARELAARMAAATEKYDHWAAECLELSRGFSEETFVSDWEALFAPNAQSAPAGIS